MLQQARGTCAALRYFAEYHCWANRAIVASLSPPEPSNSLASSTSPTSEVVGAAKCSCLFFTTIKATLSHIAIVDDLWYHRIINQPKYEYDVKYSDSHPAGMWDNVHPSLESATTELFKNDTVLLEYVLSLERELASEEQGEGRARRLFDPKGLQYYDTKGAVVFKQEAACLMHVFNHATHHRGQVHAAISHLKESEQAPWLSPPPLDMPIMEKMLQF